MQIARGIKLLLCSSIVATHQPSREHRLHPRCQPDHTPSPPPIRPSSSPTYHPALLANLLSEVFPRIPPQFRRKPSETAESFPLGTYSLLGTVVTKVGVAWSSRDKYTREELTFSLRFRQVFSWKPNCSDELPSIRDSLFTRQDCSSYSFRPVYPTHLVHRLCHCQQPFNTIMATWRHAFSLSKEELRDSEPPGTIRLVGLSQPYTGQRF